MTRRKSHEPRVGRGYGRARARRRGRDGPHYRPAATALLSPYRPATLPLLPRRPAQGVAGIDHAEPITQQGGQVGQIVNRQRPVHGAHQRNLIHA